MEESPMRIDRRTFLKNTLQGSIALGLAMAGMPTSLADTGSGGEEAEPRIRQYRVLGRTGLKVSDIGAGTYTLTNPQVLSYSLDLGVNLIATSPTYGFQGKAEQTVGEAIRLRRRDVVLITKWPSSTSYSKERMLESLEESLTRLQTDYVDCIMLHSVDEPGRISDPEVLRAFRQAKEQGRVRFLGVSSHSANMPLMMEQAVDAGTFDVLLLAYNFGEYPDLTRILGKAHARGVGVVAMKTLKGASREDQERFRTPNGTLRQAAFRWVLSNPQVSGLLAAMNSFREVRESVGASGHPLSQEEQTLLQRYTQLTSRRYCRIGCGHCAGACEHKIPIADILRFRMYSLQYGLETGVAAEYRDLGAKSLASACFACRDPRCASRCPFELPVQALLCEAHQLLSMHA
jgi:predicted aldo/keto reductase-like oxidoreductase